jgi:protein-tyrosine phosphatase
MGKLTDPWTMGVRACAGVVIACYLVAEEGFCAHEAISLVREKRPHSLVCPKQELAVHRFEAHLDELARH